MAPEYSIWDSVVGPESKDLHVAFLVVESIQMASTGELDLSAPSDFVESELCHCYVILVDRVDAYTVDMSDYDVETTGMDRYSHYCVLKTLDEL